MPFERLPGRAPTVPSMGGRSLALWVGDHHGALLDDPGLDVTGTVAMRLANVARNRTAVSRARRELGAGLCLETEAWRNQCRPDHRLRGSAFRDAGFDVRDMFGIQRLDIDRELSASQIKDYAYAHLQAQVAEDATIFQTPGHVISSSGGWANAVALAEATAREVERRGLREPAAGDRHGLPRALFATLCVRLADVVDRGAIRELVALHATLPVDGFWVWIIGFEPSGIQAERVLHLVLALQENTGLPACPGGMSHLWHAALARGAAGAVAGPDRGGIAFMPDEPPPPPRDPDDPDEPRQLHTYLGSVLGCFPTNSRGEASRAEAFRRSPCPCGHHPPKEPPRGRAQIGRHNQYWRLVEARAACVGAAADASQRLEARLPAAAAERRAVGLGRLARGWGRAVQPWPNRDVGWGAAGGLAA